MMRTSGELDEENVDNLAPPLNMPTPAVGDSVNLFAWVDCETTPMTSRPHFGKSNYLESLSNSNSPVVQKRNRSKSLGEGVDDLEDLNNFEHTSSLFRPDRSQNVLPTPQTAPVSQHVAQSGELRSDSTTSVLIRIEDMAQFESTSTFDQENIPSNPIWICVLYGLINATIVTPVLISFASIIYRNDAFQPYMPVLVRLTMVSGIVHQLCFSTFSSLPFAIGQVQDAGLIFLSSMASYMVEYLRRQDPAVDDEVMLATVTIGLSICTALLGCGLVIIGRLRLAQYVQMLPTSVVGGYLAYIGWFCGISGVGIMAGSSNLTTEVLMDKFFFILPGVWGGFFIYLFARRLRHMAVLPACILFLLIAFYITISVLGYSLGDATQKGWIRETEPTPPWYHTWDYLKFDKVVWSAFPGLIVTELGMIFVVALSSSLDVAAIELELKRPLHYNHELATVGLSNIVSGLTGGYTGSYIFSQSIFSLRSGIRSRSAGYVLAIFQIIVLLLPVPILHYVPNFFFGSLLSMICIDLMYEWLYDVRHKLTVAEYVICLSTFGLIMVLRVEYGILAGVFLHAVCRKLGFNVGDGAEATSGGDRSSTQEKVKLINSHTGQGNGKVEANDNSPLAKPSEKGKSMNYGSTA